MKKKIIIGGLLSLIVIGAISLQGFDKIQLDTEAPDYGFNVDKSIEKPSNKNPGQNLDTLSKDSSKCHYKEIPYPTPNIDLSRKNTVEGVILHHTAEPTIERSLGVLTSLKKRVGIHVVIDTDGTRYIMCEPETVTYHAGFSILKGKEDCNKFTIGIEFQGNTLEKPLTQDQINSAIDYLLPILKKYRIPLDCIVTHEMVRKAYKAKYPHRKCSGKVDITQTEYKRFMKALLMALRNKNTTNSNYDRN